MAVYQLVLYACDYCQKSQPGYSGIIPAGWGVYQHTPILAMDKNETVRCPECSQKAREEYAINPMKFSVVP